MVDLWCIYGDLKGLPCTFFGRFICWCKLSGLFQTLQAPGTIGMHFFSKYRDEITHLTKQLLPFTYYELEQPCLR